MCKPFVFFVLAFFVCSPPSTRTEAFGQLQHCRRVVCRSTFVTTRRTTTSTTTSLPLSSEEESDPVVDNDGEEKQISNGPPEQPASSEPASTYSEQKKDDIPAAAPEPLFVALTRMDEETANAPTMQVPIWGELILDKSLFILLPVAAFAVIGLALSIYVGMNAEDTFVLDVAPTTPTADYGSGCRGLCSSQENDLEGLRVFMDALKK